MYFQEKLKYHYYGILSSLLIILHSYIYIVMNCCVCTTIVCNIIRVVAALPPINSWTAFWERGLEPSLLKREKYSIGTTV